MRRPTLIQASLLAALLVAVCAQRLRFSCDTEGNHVICRSNDSQVEFLNETATWREAHELCRRRRGFLVPSRAVFDDTLLRELRERAFEHGEFWLGAKYLRNGYFEWLLQMYDEEISHYEKIGVSPEVDPSNLCGRVTTVNNDQLALRWLRCAATQKVVCFSDEKTNSETRPAGYQPSMSVISGDNAIQPKTSADEVLVVSRTSLDVDFRLNITCGAGDSIVKDHFVLGKTLYDSSWWTNNFTIMKQVFPFNGGDLLGVGTFWCQRYVEGAMDPVVSGRLHVTTSEDMYALTAPEDSVVATLQRLLSDDLLEPTPSDKMSDIAADLRLFLRTDANEIHFLALYDFPNSRTARQEASNATEETLDKTRQIVSLVMESTKTLDGELLSGPKTTRIGNASPSEPFLQNVFRCPEENVDGRVWRQSSYDTHYTASEPKCVAPDHPALVERRCRPSFDRVGARWGPFCAAGVCQEQLQRCEPPPPICPPGFTGTTLGSEVPSVLCMLLLTGVTLEERVSACRRRDPSAMPWFPRQRLLELSFLSPPLVNQTVWLPFKRLWLQGPLMPQVLSLLSRDDREVASLNGDLNCSVLTPLGRLASSSCAERHAVVCATRPLYSHDVQPTLQRSSARGRLCQSLLGLGAMPADGSERCFAFLCTDTTSPMPWSEASSLCTDSNSSLASLTSQRQIDALVRLGRSREGPVRAAVNLERHNGRVLWGDGTPLSYPALSPDLSTAEQHIHGILDLSRGQYNFVGREQRAVNCAVCDRHIQVGPPEIFLFYGDGLAIFANVTNVQQFAADWEDALSCFASTAERMTSLSFRPTKDQADERDGFRVRFNVLTTNDGRVFIRLTPSVDFGYLICGLLIAESGEQITSNSLPLRKTVERLSVQEYVIGLRGGQWHNSHCDLTFCVATCSCFNQSLNAEYLIHENSGRSIVFHQEMHPLRATLSDGNRVIAHYFVALDFSLLLRRRRQTESRDTDRPRQITDQFEDPQQCSPGQIPARHDGFRILRGEFGSQLEYVKHARCCPAERTKDPMPLCWPETCGGVATSVELCVDSSGLPAFRRCMGGPLTGVWWGQVNFTGTSCVAASAVTTDLHKLSQVTVTATNLVSTADDLKRLTDEPAALVSKDLVSAAVTLENIQAALEGRDPPLPEDLPTLPRSTVATVSHIMDADRAAIAVATESFAIGPRVVRALEHILIDSFRESDPDVTTDNVAFRSGNVVGVSSSAREITETSQRTLARGTARSAAFGVETALILEMKKPNATVMFLVYRDGRLLQSRGQRVTSQVVSALLPTEQNETQFSREVLVTFRSLPGKCVRAPTCAFWDTAASQWSTRGCWLDKVHNGSDVCRCNHLTNFARIFNFETDVYLSEAYHRTLDMITYVGSALSLLGLFLTMTTFVLFKKWHRKSDREINQIRGNQIVMHMSVALTGVYLTFLGTLAATENHVACVCLSALLHFFLLATFGWMSVEAVFQYLRFAWIVGSVGISRFMLKASLLAWGGSLVPVICLLAARPHCYDGQLDVCWMDFQSFLYALALPVVAVMVFNAVMFGLIVYSLNCGRQKGLRTNQSERQQALLRLRASIFTFVLLGLHWVFGFLSIREARLVFAVPFCICSMLQGFAIFLLMVAGNPRVRDQWRRLLVGQCCSADTNTAASEPVLSATSDTSDTLMSSRSQQDTRF